MKILFAAVLAAAVAAAAPAGAQLLLKRGTPPIFLWTPQQQSDWYRSIETIYKSETIKAGPNVHPLPKSSSEIAPSWTYAGRSWTLEQYMAENRTSAVLVIKDGRIVLERYAMGRTPDSKWTTFSVAKSVTSTLVGAAIQDGKIKGLDAQVVDYLPDLKGSAYDGVTVRQILTMTSGVKWNEDYTDPKSDIARAGFTDLEPGVNPLIAYVRKLPRAHAPGTTFNYNSAETDMAGLLVASAVGKPLAQYLSEKIWIPYGMETDGIWATDLSGRERGGCCISMTLRDYGRVGQFILDGGKASGKSVVPPGWVADATRKQVENGYGGYGYFWWIRPDGGYDADGIYGQSISTFPEERLIVVINSAWPEATDDTRYAARTAFLTAVRASARLR